MSKEIKFLGKELDANTRNAIAGNVLVEGARPLSWWRKQSNDLHGKFMREMRTSLENGESVGKAAVRITGGTVNGVQVTGIMKTTAANANTLARTALNKVTNEARIASFEANKAVVKGMKQISTLDSVTSQICIAYDGQVWQNTKRKKPVPPSTLPFNAGPPRHFNCRSTLVPVLKSWKELGIPAKELSTSTRVSMDGQIPADTTFDAFLKSKGKAFQDNILGPAKARLWRSNKITLAQLVDFRGNPLSTEQLIAAAAKRKATATAARAPKPAPKPKPVKKGVSVSGEPKEAVRWQTASWDDAPGYLTRTIEATAPLKLVTADKGGSFFRPGAVQINMAPGFDTKSTRGKGMWRHEYGHHLDRQISEQLPEAVKISARRHVSASGNFLKAFAADTRSINKAAGGKTASVAFDNTTSVFQGHLRKTMDEGTDYLDRKFKKFGLSYKGMRDLHRKHMDVTVESQNDVIMRNKMAMLLAAMETGNAQFYINQVWEVGKFFESGMAGYIADFYGAITKNRVGYGHSAGYYKGGRHKQTTEAFANAVSIIGGEPDWIKVIRAFGHDKFINEVDTLLKNGGKL